MKYESLFAKYYDYIAHDRREALATEGDIAFIKDAFSTRCARAVRDIIDIGCGTGRYLIPLAEAGYNIIGIDNSPEILAHCRARLRQRKLDTVLMELDIMEMDASDSYDSILCMDSTICYFTERKDIIKALSLFKRALRPGGLLVLEIFNPFTESQSLSTPDIREIRDDRLLINVKEYSHIDPVRSVRQTTIDVTVINGEQRHEFSRVEVLRVITAAEMAGYLKETGFADISCELRPDSISPDSGDEDLVFLAVKEHDKPGQAEI